MTPVTNGTNLDKVCIDAFYLVFFAAILFFYFSQNEKANSSNQIPQQASFLNANIL